MNRRMERLREWLLAADPRIYPERYVYFTESMKETEGKPVALRRSQAFYGMLSRMTAYMNVDELIVGNQAQQPKASPVYPEYSMDQLEAELGGSPFSPDRRPGGRFYYTQEGKDKILRYVEYWKGKSLYENLRRILPDKISQAWDANVIGDTWVSAAGLGDVIVDYKDAVNRGLSDVMRRIENKLKRLDPREPGDTRKRWFLEAAPQGNQTVVMFSGRIADHCKEQAEQEKDEIRRRGLLKLEGICRNVPLNPAGIFHEAVQSIYMILLAVHLESSGYAISLGCFDQYVYPHYKKDLGRGRITRKEALEIVECFFIKYNELNKLRNWPDTEFFLGYQILINLAVAGQTVDGKDATNEVSHLCVEACENVRLSTPSVPIRWFEGASDAFITKALRAAQRHQGGQPAFYNDEAFVETLESVGIAEEDRVSWVPDGYIEASIPERWDSTAKGPWLNVEKVLEITLHDGMDPKTGYHFVDLGKHAEGCGSVRGLIELYKQAPDYFMGLQVETEHINDEIHIQQNINTFRSSLVCNCIERAMDLVEGGSVYSAGGRPTASTISTRDSLTTLDEIVFNQKLLTMEQVLHTMSTNYEDMETVPARPKTRAILLNRAPEFGNDNEGADKWVVGPGDHISSSYRYRYRSSKYGKGPVPCYYSYSQSPATGNIAFGKGIRAIPDERKDGQQVNNGISPTSGSEKKDATVACNSVMKLPNIWFQKGAIFNMRLSKGALGTGESKEKVVAMIKMLFENYGQQIQSNVMDNKVFKKAMGHPDEYKDLMVRVSGYSALFTSLSPECQMDVVSRTEPRLQIKYRNAVSKTADDE